MGKAKFHTTKSFNKLNSLKNFPEIVNKHLDCSFNNLTTLEGSLKEVGYTFKCKNNEKLKNVKVELPDFEVIQAKHNFNFLDYFGNEVSNY